jgi:hypothetical protein
VTKRREVCEWEVGLSEVTYVIQLLQMFEEALKVSLFAGRVE